MRLTIILPTYNEVQNLRRMVEALLALEIPGTELGILVADSDSPDGTGELATQLDREHPGRVALLSLPRHAGLGAAYLAAFARALDDGAELVGQMDCDFSHQPRHLPALVAAAASADLVIGSRYVAGGRLDPQWPWWRVALSAFANRIYIRCILGMPVRDATSGFRIWRREALLALDPARHVRGEGYVFLVELAYLAWRAGLRIREVPIEFLEREAGTSKMNLRIQLEAAWRVLDVRRRHRRR
jgi:dolichol-phosphate mannosyltransferase